MEPSTTLSPAEAAAARKAEEATRALAARFDAEAEAARVEPLDASQLLEWAFTHGRRPSNEEIEIWNAFMTKRGWRDAGTRRLHERLAEIGLPPDTVQTMFEFIDLDEGRIPAPR